MARKLFATEVELCAAFISWAEKNGATCFPEWKGWDILVVLPSGQQIGVQAKLSCNDQVMLQALPGDLDLIKQGPDFRAILVPSVGPPRGSITHRLGLIVFEPKMEWSPGCLGYGLSSERSFLGSFSPAFEFTEYWLDWNPESRLKLPETATDSIAGSPSPVTLTLWKLKAISLVAELEVLGRVHRSRVLELGLSMTIWTQRRWLKPAGERGYWVRGETCPSFETQHPSAYASALRRAREASPEVFGEELIALPAPGPVD